MIIFERGYYPPQRDNKMGREGTKRRRNKGNLWQGCAVSGQFDDLCSEEMVSFLFFQSCAQKYQRTT